MPVTVAERNESPRVTSGDSPGVEHLYWVRGTDDRDTARTALLAEAPATSDGYPLLSNTLEYLGNELWDATVAYGPRDNSTQETGSSVFTFETGGATQHITQSLETRSSVGIPDFTVPDTERAIGLNGDSVEGVDIIVPQFNFSETHYIADASVDTAYKLALYALTGKVNNATFRGFAAGEVLFRGASGSRRVAPGGDIDWEITFQFSAAPSDASLSISPDLTVNKEGGWDYVWVMYKDTASPMGVQKTPVAAFVERVYESADFAGLGIGT